MGEAKGNKNGRVGIYGALESCTQLKRGASQTSLKSTPGFIQRGAQGGAGSRGRGVGAEVRRCFGELSLGSRLSVMPRPRPKVAVS